MWQYVNYSDELAHYGVKGMKWGVRRASKKLSSATTDKERSKAVASLQKHREKGSAKVEKLNKSLDKLQKQREKQKQTTDVKAAQYERQAALARMKSQNRLSFRSSREKAMNEAIKWETKADVLRSQSAKTQALIDKNATMKKLFEQQISDIDSILVTKGKKYLGVS